MPRPFLLAGLLLATLAAPRAQGIPFIGTAVDAATGEPLPGATALVAGQRGGTAAGSDGQFRLVLPALPDTVVVRFVGFATAQTVVTARDVRAGVVRRTVRLSAEPSSLGEAVVTSEPPGEKLWRRVLARREALAARVAERDQAPLIDGQSSPALCHQASVKVGARGNALSAHQVSIYGCVLARLRQLFGEAWDDSKGEKSDDDQGRLHG